MAAFAEDPFLFVKGTSLHDALHGTHRIYFYYRHEPTRPVPYKEYYMDIQLSTEAIHAIESKYKC